MERRRADVREYQAYRDKQRSAICFYGIKEYFDVNPSIDKEIQLVLSDKPGDQAYLVRLDDYRDITIRLSNGQEERQVVYRWLDEKIRLFPQKKCWLSIRA